MLYDQHNITYTLRKDGPGPILITNYDVNTLSHEERAKLNKLAGDTIPAMLSSISAPAVTEAGGL
ncbi:MAG: hypothetical protein H0U72_03800 [Nitrosospira sp.]|nr:hypothetical protein [Nitrosospira sp.]